jgi:hypothetical protein
MVMNANKLLYTHFEEFCETIHSNRLKALMDVAVGVQRSQSLALSAIGRNLPGTAKVKHKIKKVDRLEGNLNLYAELGELYEGLSNYIFKYIAKETSTPIIIDLCYLKDNRKVQMLSAEVPLKGRSLPLYREVFESGELSGRAKTFINHLSQCVPHDREVIVVMDAGFSEDWFAAIEELNWYWLVRVRQGKRIKLAKDSEWLETKAFLGTIEPRAKHYAEAFLMKTHERSCRLVTKKNAEKNTKAKYKKLPRDYNAGSGDYRRSAKEPWILATNLPKNFNTTQILSFYKKRMQIEESFRDLKSHQFGLSARYVKTDCVYRWSVKMILGAIVQVIYWITGIVAYSQNFHSTFQANTVKDRKVFSYFYLGQLMFEYEKIDRLNFEYDQLPQIIERELARW